MDATDLCFTPAIDLAEMIRRRALSPVELIRAVLERIERLNPRLGSYVLVHAERALAEARAAEQAVMAGRSLGPLHGVPISIKDHLRLASDGGVRADRGRACRGGPARGRRDFHRPDQSPGVRMARFDRQSAV